MYKKNIKSAFLKKFLKVVSPLMVASVMLVLMVIAYFNWLNLSFVKNNFRFFLVGVCLLLLFDIFNKMWKRNFFTTASPKLIDSSALIDGRIVELAKLNILEGPFILPSFILEELHRLADSKSGARRLKGRRGLDILSILSSLKNVKIRIDESEFSRRDVDSQLIDLAVERSAKIITTDFNLTKVAEVKSVEVINLNLVANVIRNIFFPSQDLKVELVKIGDKSDQAVGYLDDGTMVVVDKAHKRIGEFVDVCVTSMLPTIAGKIVFGRLK